MVKIRFLDTTYAINCVIMRTVLYIILIVTILYFNHNVLTYLLHGVESCLRS